MLKRIGITGPESTGKSTLVHQLAGHFNSPYVPELARAFLHENGPNFNRETVVLLAGKQLLLEEEKCQGTAPFLFCDTDALNFKIWLEYYGWEVPLFINSHLSEKKYDLHLLTNIDLPWVADPLRKNEHNRAQIFRLFKNTLDELELPYKIVNGSGKARLENAISELQIISML